MWFIFVIFSIFFPNWIFFFLFLTIVWLLSLWLWIYQMDRQTLCNCQELQLYRHLHWRLPLWTCFYSSSWSEQMEIRSQRDTLKFTPWENSEKDVTCLLDCKIDWGWHVAVCPQQPNLSCLTDNAFRLSRCPSYMCTNIAILKMGSSTEEGNIPATAKAAELLLVPRWRDHMAAYPCISVIQRVSVCGYTAFRCMYHYISWNTNR